MPPRDPIRIRPTTTEPGTPPARAFGIAGSARRALVCHDRPARCHAGRLLPHPLHPRPLGLARLSRLRRHRGGEHRLPHSRTPQLGPGRGGLGLGRGRVHRTDPRNREHLGTPGVGGLVGLRRRPFDEHRHHVLRLPGLSGLATHRRGSRRRGPAVRRCWERLRSSRCRWCTSRSTSSGRSTKRRRSAPMAPPWSPRCCWRCWSTWSPSPCSTPPCSPAASRWAGWRRSLEELTPAEPAGRAVQPPPLGEVGGG